MNRDELKTHKKELLLSSQFDFSFFLSFFRVFLPPETSFLLRSNHSTALRDKFMVIFAKQVWILQALRLIFSLTLSPRIIYQNVFNHSFSSLGLLFAFCFLFCWFNFVVLLLSISCFRALNLFVIRILVYLFNSLFIFFSIHNARKGGENSIMKIQLRYRVSFGSARIDTFLGFASWTNEIKWITEHWVHTQHTKTENLR